MTRSSPYITVDGKQALLQELQELRYKKRPRVTKILSEAAAEGDRSENAEYIYRKKQLREIDRRIRYLMKRVDEVQAVEHKPHDTSKVYFGAWIKLIDEDEGVRVYRIVGADEFDPEQGYISIDSPVAKALLGKTVDDEVEIQVPKGLQYFEVAAISYEGEAGLDADS